MIRKTTLVLLAFVIAGSALAVAADNATGGVVNINTADEEQLQLLPRIGPALAGRIVDFRDANGPFGSVDELVAVKGIGESALGNLKPYVRTKGDTTLSAKVSIPRSSAGDSPSAAR